MRYNIKKNREVINAEEIRLQMNFDNFLKMKNPGVNGGLSLGSRGWWTAGAVLTIGTVALFTIWNKSETQPSPSDFGALAEKSSSFITPVKNANIAFTSYKTNADQGGTYTYPSGSKLIVPKDAFVNVIGDPVKGPVEIRYREFHKPADFFLSGIPMTYDSAGTQYHFESGGMLELLAFQDDKPVFANPENPIRIEMASRENGNYFNTYYLDTLERKWKFISKDTVGVAGNWREELDSLLASANPSQVLKYVADQLQKAEEELKKAEKIKPISPRIASKTGMLFTIDVDTAQFPEVAKFESVKFEVDSKDKSFDASKAKKIWRSVKLERVTATNDYAITFTNWREKYTVKAWPVLEGKDLLKARKEFDAEYALYDQKKRIKEDKKKKHLNQLRSLNEQYSGQVDFDNNDMKLLRQWSTQVSASTEVVFRIFYADKFGIFNCDCPKMLPKGKEVVAIFVDSSGKKLKLDKAYLVEKGKNAVFTYYESKFNDFRYDPKKTNMVWTVTLDGRIATIDAKAFKKVKPVRDTCVYSLTVNKERVKTDEDARKLLNM